MRAARSRRLSSDGVITRSLQAEARKRTFSFRLTVKGASNK